MNPVEVLSADTHLAPRSWAKHPGLAGDAYYGLIQLVDFCIINHAGLTLAGDILDKTKPDSATAKVMRTQLRRMEIEKLPVRFTQGQHELDRDNPWLNSLSDWPEHVHRKQFALNPGIIAYGIDWMPADAIQEEFAKIPPNTQMLIGHQVWRDLMGPRIGESECAFSDVPHVRQILTGDFHRHLNITAINRSAQSVQILSPGPLCMQSIDEDPHKQFFVIYDDGTIGSQSLRTRQCFRFVIGDEEELEVFLAGNVEQAVEPQTRVPDYIAKNIVHIHYRGDIPEAYHRITNAIDNRAHLFLIPTRQEPTVVNVDTEKRRALADGGLEGCLEVLIDKASPMYRDLLLLLQSQAPAEQLQTMHSLFLQNCGGQGDREQI